MVKTVRILGLMAVAATLTAVSACRCPRRRRRPGVAGTVTAGSFKNRPGKQNAHRAFPQVDGAQSPARGLVARGGVEPPTFRFSVGRSYQLSYLALMVHCGPDGT